MTTISHHTWDKIQNGRQGSFEYELYYLPIRDEDLKTTIIDRLLARRSKNNPDDSCLGATRENLEKIINNRYIDVIGFFRHSRYPEDEVSGTIQIDGGYAYIADLCRNYSEYKNRFISPITILLKKFEEIIRTEFYYSKVYVRVVVQDGSDILRSIYKRYGFIEEANHEFDDENEYVIMGKTLAKTLAKTSNKSMVTKRRGGKRKTYKNNNQHKHKDTTPK